MALASVFSRARVGLESPLINVEVHLANGLPAFNIVGLPETSVKESKDRVRSAIINCGYDFPARFQLIAAMNPSPTGFYNDNRSTPEQVLRYLNKLLGPFLDRIDIQIEVAQLPKGMWANQNTMSETTKEIQASV